MKQRQCPKCGILVENAKAFCPDCGGSMIAEQKREVAPEFDLQANTVEFNDSDFGKMMKDMGLDISESQDSGKQVEEKVPVVIKAKVIERPVPTAEVKETKGSKTAFWLLAGGILVFLILLISILAVVGVLLYMR